MRRQQIGLLILIIPVLIVAVYFTTGRNDHVCTGTLYMTTWTPEQIGENTRTLSEEIEANPTEVQAYLDRGSAYSLLCEWDRALADYDKVLELEPGNSYAHSNRGYVFFNRGEWSLAIEAFSESLKIEKCADTYVKRATAYGRSEMRQEAQNDLKQAMRMDECEPNNFYASGLYHQWCENYDEAVSYYDSCISARPDEAEAYWYRAECLAALGLREDAIEAYREYAKRVNPLDTVWMGEVEQKIEELEQKTR